MVHSQSVLLGHFFFYPIVGCICRKCNRKMSDFLATKSTSVDVLLLILQRWYSIFCFFVLLAQEMDINMGCLLVPSLDDIYFILLRDMVLLFTVLLRNNLTKTACKTRSFCGSASVAFSVNQNCVSDAEVGTRSVTYTIFRSYESSTVTLNVVTTATVFCVANGKTFGIC